MKRSMGLVAVLGVLVVAAAAGAWVWSPWAPSPASTETTATGERPSVAPEVGAQAPEFTATTLEGEEIALSDLQGRPVILDFWASWCPNCNATAPHLARFHQEHPDATIVGINMDMDEGKEAASSHVREYDIQYPIVMDDGSITQSYRVTTTSTYFFIDEQGVIREIHKGTSLDYEAIQTAFEKAVPSEG